MTAASSPHESPVAVVIMAKQPIPGQTKTRLHGELTEQEAAALYTAMLSDRCAQIARLAGVVPAIAIANYRVGAAELELGPPGFRRVPQPDTGGLGAGLATAAAAFLNDGIPVVLVDSDSPTLPSRFLQNAVDRVRGDDSDLVLGPAEDGGYYLLGLSRAAPELFRDIPWSTSAVAETTLERARTLGLDVHVLPRWWDVDTPADLSRLRYSLLDAPWPEQTATWLRQHGQTEERTETDATVPAEERWCAPWKTLSSRLVYATPWLSIREDAVRLPDGGGTTYSVVDCGECVGVLPFVDPDTVLLIQQYRYVSGKVSYEMPTGGVHPGEPRDDAIRRELAEEALVHAGSLDYLGAYTTSKSVMRETAHLYVARDLSPTTPTTSDDTEFIRIERVPFERALHMVLSGDIGDSMTIIAILRAALGRSAAE